MTNQFKTLDYQEEEGVGLLSFNRPEALNALSDEMIKEARQLIESLGKKKLKGLILTGSGEKAFIAGADIKSMSGMSAEQAQEFAFRGQQVTLLLEESPFPVIAAVNGFALGGGFEMALACDFMLASESAVFGLPETSLGLIPGFGGTQRLAKIVGRNRAKEMIYTGRKFKAKEALELGLVLSLSGSKTELIQAAKAIVLACSSNSLNAIGVAKRVINHGVDLSTEDGLKIEKKYFGEIFSSFDMKEGTRAFLEKRKANFKGE
ncbi:MAG: enoyl-CoA hydratase-related protein [Bacteriovoracaceae bacterium]